MRDFSELKFSIEQARRGNSDFFTINTMKRGLKELYDYIDSLNAVLNDFDDFKGSAIIKLDDHSFSKSAMKITGNIIINCNDCNKRNTIKFVYSYPNELKYLEPSVFCEENEKTIFLSDLEDMYLFINSSAFAVMAG